MSSSQGCPLLLQGNRDLANSGLCKNQTIKDGGEKEPIHIFLSSKFQDLDVKDKVLADRNFIRVVKQRWGFAEAGSRKTAGAASGWAAACGHEWGGQRNRTPGANAHSRSHRTPLLWACLPGVSCCSRLWKLGVASMSHSLLHFTYLHSQHHTDVVVKFCT